MRSLFGCAMLVAACGAPATPDPTAPDSVPPAAQTNATVDVGSAAPSPRPTPSEPLRPLFPVGGTVVGLDPMTRVVLRNGADEVAVTGEGSFRFSTRLEDGAPYAVTVSSAPRGVSCTVDHATGTIDGGDALDVTITCRLSFCAFDGSFEDGGTGRFVNVSPSTTEVAVTTEAAANGTGKGLRLSGWSGKQEGAHVTYVAARPTAMSWWERIGPSAGASGYVVPSDAFGRFPFWMYAYGGEWVADGGDARHTATLGAWTYFVATFDWDLQTYSITIDAEPFVVNAAFQAPGVDGIAALDLFDFNFDATTDYDEFQISCAP